MTCYRYLAMDQVGRRHRGVLEQPSEYALVSALQQQGLELLTCKCVRPWRLPQKRIDSATLILFCVQMEQLLQAGVPILQAVSDLAAQEGHNGMLMALRNISHELESGKQLSQAMQAQPLVFPLWAAQLVEAGERTGQLPSIFGHLIRTLTWQLSMQSQLRQGLTYPALLFAVVALAAYVMLTFLVPQMASFLQGLGQSLPWSTRCLLAISEGVIAHGAWASVAAITALLAAVLAQRHSSSFAMWLDRVLLKFPILGPLWYQLVLARLCRFLGLMYQTGIPLLQALQWCRPLLQQRLISQALTEVYQRVQAGETLTSGFAATHVFPPLMLRLLSVGETTGSLDRMLFQLATFYDEALQLRLQTLLRLIEPVLTITLGLMLLFLMAAVMLPIYDSFSSMRY